jgi:hypothetical protein
MTDTPLQPPPTTLERVKVFIGDLARPFAIITTSGAASVATVIIAGKVENGNDGAIFIGGVFAGVSALFLGKAWEVVKGQKAGADVEIAKARGEAQ